MEDLLQDGPAREGTEPGEVLTLKLSISQSLVKLLASFIKWRLVRMSQTGNPAWD